MTGAIAATGFVAALLPASADAATKTRPRWMVGQWAWVSPAEPLARGDCPESETYGGNGVVTDGEDVSRWWLEGEVLVRVTVKPGYGEPASEKGHVFRSRFTRVSRDKLVFRGDGTVQWLVRCASARDGQPGH